MEIEVAADYRRPRELEMSFFRHRPRAIEGGFQETKVKKCRGRLNCRRVRNEYESTYESKR